MNCEGGQTVRREFSGTGSAVRPNGSAIHSELTGAFGVSESESDLGSLSHLYFYGSMTRVHRSPAKSLVCTETYQVEGVK